MISIRLQVSWRDMQGHLHDLPCRAMSIAFCLFCGLLTSRDPGRITVCTAQRAYKALLPVPSGVWESY